MGVKYIIRNEKDDDKNKDKKKVVKTSKDIEKMRDDIKKFFNENDL